MVNKTLGIACFAFFHSISWASGYCTKGAEFEPALCPMVFPKIQSVQISENGAKGIASKDEQINCSNFKVNVKIIRKFLFMTKEVSEDDARHTLDWSSCFARGTVVFVGGKKAHWSVNQLRGGSLAIDGGQKKYLYCPACKFKPFK